MILERWKASLHGGHSGQYCEHASGRLREILEAAVAFGYHTFGVTEHAPRLEERFLYTTEVERGWDVPRLVRNFEDYAAAVSRLAEEFSDRLVVLRGFEAEVVPQNGYAEQMLGYRRRFGFDYVLGSVHYVDERLIDGPVEEFEAALETLGGLDALAVRYYQTLARMVRDLQPEVVGHLDVIRKNGRAYGPLDTPRIRRAAGEALEAIREAGAILDVNSQAYRRELETAYPDAWLLRTAWDMGLAFCFGDDSHAPGQVGAGLEKARGYLLENGVGSITVLVPEGGSVGRRDVPLE